MRLLSLALLCLLIAGAIGRGLKSNSSDAEHPGKCVYEDLILSPGEEGQPKGKCQRFTCGKDLVGHIESCDYRFIILEPPCWWGDLQNPEFKYPDCCMRKVICPERSGFGDY
ncbi:uncharacterized protein [Musca autumnalis]|uniref:uncharacterized protein n=1 Tax=Musca autumnalis TaxID=221902 RepID=UPI003CEC4676